MVRQMGSPHETVRIDFERLLAVQSEVQKDVGGVNTTHLGLGSSVHDNMALRKQVGKPGSPFGGLGFFDPGVILPSTGDEVNELAAEGVTAEKVRSLKLEELRACATGQPSFYFYALQPIVDTRDRVVAFEILARGRNGADSAPYEDLHELRHPSAEVQEVYTKWKIREIVDWPLAFLREHPALLQVKDGMFSNLRPADLSLSSPVFLALRRRLEELERDDSDGLELLKKMVHIEVTEDEEAPPDLEDALSAWRELGFKFSYDDTMGVLAASVFGKGNFHTTASLSSSLLEHFAWLKVDIEWAGYGIFLSHPSYSSRKELKEVVLYRAQEEDLVYRPTSSGLESTGLAHSAICREFADWSLAMIAKGKRICIELTVREADPNNAFALSRLKEMGLDIFGSLRGSFCLQGGLTGAKAFEPHVIAKSFLEP
mmetsp:Transcript_37499/g.82254  ORF Transcript_37499/g.82254 Transcript_37499/m.82254 type:complete len:429 (+) Transcript_37499:55-1341(+)